MCVRVDQHKVDHVELCWCRSATPSPLWSTTFCLWLCVEACFEDSVVDKANAMSPCEHLLEVPHECCPTVNWPLRLLRRFTETRRSIAHDIAARLSALPLDPAASVAADSGRVIQR
jgi:hypothetical protein